MYAILNIYLVFDVIYGTIILYAIAIIKCLKVVSKPPIRFKVKAEHANQTEEYIEYFEY
jgi:hypothetical protein